MHALDGLDAAIERAPRHDLRMREMLPLAANFPDPIVGLIPIRLEEFEQHALKRPSVGILLEPRGACERKRIDDLAVDVELELRRGLVADAHRR